MNWFSKNSHGLEVEAALRATLSNIIDPRTGQDLLTGKFITSAAFEDDDKKGAKVTLTIEMPGGSSPLNDKLQSEVQKAAERVNGISKVLVVATAHRQAGQGGPGQEQITRGHANPLGVKGGVREGQIATPLIRRIVAIASGKGGVGKSTIAANLAVAFAKKGWRTGLMDVDIYGPSLPVLFGLTGKAPFADGQIQPVEAHGVKAMSMGLLVEEQKALAWRGPMVMGAVQQMFTEVNWGALDILLVDTPPGTGDAHLTLLQKVALSGAVIVSTPQEMALADVRRGAGLFRQLKAPILGLIENMAWLDLPDGSRQYLFGKGGAKQSAAALDIDFLGEVPLVPALQAASDQGTPLTASPNETVITPIFAKIVSQLEQKLDLVAEPNPT